MINIRQKDKIIHLKDGQKVTNKDRQKDRYREILKFSAKSFNNKINDKYQVER